jgi:uncharacterized protein YjiS (DUF1127 family)
MESVTAVPRRVGAACDDRPAAGRRIVDGIVRIVMRFATAGKRSQRRRALAALDDHMLHDIGLTREDLVRRVSRCLR